MKCGKFQTASEKAAQMQTDPNDHPSYKLNRLMYAYRETAEEIAQHKTAIFNLENKLNVIHADIAKLTLGGDK